MYFYFLHAIIDELIKSDNNSIHDYFDECVKIQYDTANEISKFHHEFLYFLDINMQNDDEIIYEFHVASHITISMMLFHANRSNTTSQILFHIHGSEE